MLELQELQSSGNRNFYFVCCFVRTKTLANSEFSHEFILMHLHYDVN